MTDFLAPVSPSPTGPDADLSPLEAAGLRLDAAIIRFELAGAFATLNPGGFGDAEEEYFAAQHAYRELLSEITGADPDGILPKAGTMTMSDFDDVRDGAADATGEIANDAWVRWFGGDCPVPPDTPVRIRLGIEEAFDIDQPARCAETWRWDHGERCHRANITHYRVVPA